MIEYQILKASRTADMERKVNDEIAAGWTCLGGPLFVVNGANGAGGLAQAMTREKQVQPPRDFHDDFPVLIRGQRVTVPKYGTGIVIDWENDFPKQDIKVRTDIDMITRDYDYKNVTIVKI